LIGRVGWLLGGCGFALLPWLYVPATGLPDTATAALAGRLGGSRRAGGGRSDRHRCPRRRGEGRYVLAATATAALLVVDAWFDTTTAAAGSDFAAATMAPGAELPLAALCGWLALRAPALPRRHSSPS